MVSEGAMAYAIGEWGWPKIPQPAAPVPCVPDGRLGQIEQRLAQLEQLYAKSHKAELMLSELKPLLVKLVEACGGEVAWRDEDD